MSFLQCLCEYCKFFLDWLEIDSNSFLIVQLISLICSNILNELIHWKMIKIDNFSFTFFNLVEILEHSLSNLFIFCCFEQFESVEFIFTKIILNISNNENVKNYWYNHLRYRDDGQQKKDEGVLVLHSGMIMIIDWIHFKDYSKITIFLVMWADWVGFNTVFHIPFW